MSNNFDLSSSIAIGLIILFILLLLYLIYQLLSKKKNTHTTIKILTILSVSIVTIPLIVNLLTYYDSPKNITLQDIIFALLLSILFCTPLTLSYLIYFIYKIFKKKDKSKKMIIGMIICILLLMTSLILVYTAMNETRFYDTIIMSLD